MSLPGALTPEAMGLFALAAFWLNALLVTGAALVDARKLWARRARWRTLDAVREGEGALLVEVARGPLARLEVDQVGRVAPGDDGVVHFADRARRGALLPATLVSDGRTITVEEGPVELWISHARLCAEEIDFARALESARKADGLRRTLRAEIGEGERVWIAGRFVSRAGGLVLEPSERLPVVVSEVEPRRFIDRALALTGALIALWLAGGGALTALALVPPVFGTWSTVGGLGLLAFFLGVLLPSGAWLRERVTPPCRRPVRGRLVRPSAPAASAR
ncbi:MAG TPA: hypothetical protein VIL20_25675 [Sandaracinaceae bacterium]